MIVVFPFCKKDADQAARLAAWIAELGPLDKGHQCMVTCARSAVINEDAPPEIRGPLEEAFNGRVMVMVPPDDANGWPQGPNLLFRRSARHLEHTVKAPWLWMEPDAIPLRPDWLDRIEEEYLAASKPFMGARVNVTGTPIHMSGVAVYPWNTPSLAPLAVLCESAAFDVNGAGQIVPQMSDTALIQHEWKPEPFPALEDLMRLRMGAVIYHQNKDGSLIHQLMRARDRKAEVISPTMSGKDPARLPPRCPGCGKTDGVIETDQKEGDTHFCAEAGCRMGYFTPAPEKRVFCPTPIRPLIFDPENYPEDAAKADEVEPVEESSLAKEIFSNLELVDMRARLSGEQVQFTEKTQEMIERMTYHLSLIANSPGGMKPVRKALGMKGLAPVPARPGPKKKGAK